MHGIQVGEIIAALIEPSTTDTAQDTPPQPSTSLDIVTLVSSILTTDILKALSESTSIIDAVKNNPRMVSAIGTLMTNTEDAKTDEAAKAKEIVKNEVLSILTNTVHATSVATLLQKALQGFGDTQTEAIASLILKYIPKPPQQAGVPISDTERAEMSHFIKQVTGALVAGASDQNKQGILVELMTSLATVFSPTVPDQTNSEKVKALLDAINAALKFSKRLDYGFLPSKVISAFVQDQNIAALVSSALTPDVLEALSNCTPIIDAVKGDSTMVSAIGTLITNREDAKETADAKKAIKNGALSILTDPEHATSVVDLVQKALQGFGDTQTEAIASLILKYIPKPPQQAGMPPLNEEEAKAKLAKEAAEMTDFSKEAIKSLIKGTKDQDNQEKLVTLMTSLATVFSPSVPDWKDSEKTQALFDAVKALLALDLDCTFLTRHEDQITKIVSALIKTPDTPPPPTFPGTTTQDVPSPTTSSNITALVSLTPRLFQALSKRTSIIDAIQANSAIVSAIGTLITNREDAKETADAKKAIKNGALSILTDPEHATSVVDLVQEVCQGLEARQIKAMASIVAGYIPGPKEQNMPKLVEDAINSLVPVVQNSGNQKNLAKLLIAVAVVLAPDKTNGPTAVLDACDVVVKLVQQMNLGFVMEPSNQNIIASLMEPMFKQKLHLSPRHASLLSTALIKQLSKELNDKDTLNAMVTMYSAYRKTKGARKWAVLVIKAITSKQILELIVSTAYNILKACLKDKWMKPKAETQEPKIPPDSLRQERRPPLLT